MEKTLGTEMCIKFESEEISITGHRDYCSRRDSKEEDRGKGTVLRCCGDCAFSASFVRESTDVSHVAGEGVELTVHKESVVIEEIKKVELKYRRAKFIYDRNYNRNEEYDEKS